MAEKDYAASKLINLHSADGTTLLIPKIPLSTVDNNAYTVDAEGNISTKGAGVSLQSAVQAEIAAAVADSVVGNYVPWTDGSNVAIPGYLVVEGDTTLAGVTATNADLTGTLDVAGKATLSDALDVAGAATLKGAVRVEGKLVAAQDMYIETTADGSTTSTKVATMADIDGITGGTLNNYYTKGEVDAIAEGTLEDANVYTDSASTALSAQITALDTKVTTDYATKVYVGEQIAAIDHLKREIVTELPTGEAIDTNTIYMVKMGDQGENVYREYMYIEGKWEIVGDSNIDFSNYYTKGEVDAALADYVTADDFNGSIANYALKTELQATSSTLNDGITAVDGKFANYFNKDHISANYVPWTSDVNIDVPGQLNANSATLADLFVGDRSTMSGGYAEICGTLNVHDMFYVSNCAYFLSSLEVGFGALAVNTSAGEGSTIVTMGDVLAVNIYSSTVTMGSMFQADIYNSTVKVYDEWQVPSDDGSSTVTSSGLAAVATEHDIAATSSSIMQVINALPGVGEGAILYDVLEDEQI